MKISHLPVIAASIVFVAGCASPPSHGPRPLPPAAIGQQSTDISKAGVQAVLDSIDKALLKKDAAAVVANYASSSVITATTFESGHKDVSTRHRDDYEQALEAGFKVFDDYTLQRRDVLIEIAADGKTAQSTSTLIEKYRFDGKMEQAVSKESVLFVIVNGKILVAKDQEETTVK